MNNTLLIFDLFGTLIRTPSTEEVKDHLNEIEEHCQGRPGLYERWLLTSNLRDSGYYASAKEYWESVGVLESEKATTLYYRANSYWLEDLREGCLETLDNLKKAGYNLALCSNAGFETLSLLRSGPLYSFFDKITISSEAKALKPSAEIYKLSIPDDKEYSRVYFIGDGGSDELAGAQEMGFTPIQISEFKGAQAQFRDISGDHVKVESLAEVVRIINLL